MEDVKKTRVFNAYVKITNMDRIEDNVKDRSALNYYDPCDGGFAYDDPRIPEGESSCCLATIILDEKKDSEDMEKLRHIKKYLNDTPLGRVVVKFYYGRLVTGFGSFIENYTPAAIPHLRNGIKNALRNYQI